MSYEIEKVENGYIVSENNYSCFKKHYVFQTLEEAINHIAWIFRERKIDENIKFVREKE